MSSPAHFILAALSSDDIVLVVLTLVTAAAFFGVGLATGIWVGRRR